MIDVKRIWNENICRKPKQKMTLEKMKVNGCLRAGEGIGGKRRAKKEIE